MTTNYDDEIMTHLSRLGESYRTYSNSEEHLAFLTNDLKGAVVKLHGDLTSENGLILTRKDYHSIQKQKPWEYWRIRMTSIFQMLPIIIIGHSLTDENIKHVLEAAKKGSGVERPVCWIAPDVPFQQRREYLERYRIRIIPYSNESGDHRNLISLLEHINDFVPPRVAVHLKQQIGEILSSPLGESASAPGFYVYNRLSSLQDFDKKRIEILVAVIESATPKLADLASFSVQEALQYAGWPVHIRPDRELSETIASEGVKLRILDRVADRRFRLSPEAEKLGKQKRQAFDHAKERFQKAVFLRIKNKFPEIADDLAVQMASDIEGSLSGYFRSGGLSLASILFSTYSGASPRQTVPSSIVGFISEASTRYDDIVRRQAFCAVSVDLFVRPGSSEREYLGRIAQGFFAFHALGVLGDVAKERLSQAKETVWLVDSNVQIGLLSLASSANALFRDCFNRLRQLGIRLFTTERLFDEVEKHLQFAQNLIEQEGEGSPSVLASASGSPPYFRSNAFLEGFVNCFSLTVVRA